MWSTAGLRSAASSTAFLLWGFGYHVVAASRLHPIYPLPLGTLRGAVTGCYRAVSMTRFKIAVTVLPIP